MTRPEEELQRTIVDYLRWTHPRLLFFAVPNQRGTRKKYEAQILKALGVRAGVSDLVLVGAGGRAVFVELKAPGRESRLSPAQKDFRNACDQIGAAYHVVSSLENFQGVLERHPNLTQRPCV